MMARMPIDPRLARMILGGAHFGALNEALIIVSALAVQDPRGDLRINRLRRIRNMLYLKKLIQIFYFI